MTGSELTPRPPTSEHAVVPADYAGKAMASLMQLHSELMEEKERRVDLYRRLMEKEQAIAELRMYVKLLEEKVAAKVEPAVPAPAPAPAPESAAARARPVPPPPPAKKARGEGPALHLVAEPSSAPAPVPAPALPGAAELAAYVASKAKPAPPPTAKREVPASPSRASAEGWKSW